MQATITRDMRRQLERENKSWPKNLVHVQKDAWPTGMKNPPFSVMRSQTFLAQFFSEADGITRMSVNRTTHNGKGWDENISWDDLMELKRQSGFRTYFAVEIYPSDKDIVNVANMRHIWILPAPLSFGWVK